ncbi:MAG: TonB-dependent receptor [Deltaproteobacteria bacterium]|nr:TonB-dependent receptor [Deltaproteobacteria bacterium]
MKNIISPIKSLGLFFVSFFFISTNPSYAETLPPVVVTANKKEVLTERTTASVTIISRKEIESQVATSVPEVLKDVAGIDLVSLGSSGDDVDIRLRGSDRDQVLVMLDGVSINNIREHRALFLGNFPLDIVDRIEIVRGPQSILYGSDAVGGVINIITKKGSKTFELPVTFEVGNLGTFREALSASGSSEKTKYLVGFSRLDQKGRFDNDQYGGWTLHGNFSYQPSEKLKFEWGGHYLHNRQQLAYEFLNQFNPVTNNIEVTIDPDNDSFSERDIVVGRAAVKAVPTKWWNFEIQYGLLVDRDLGRNLSLNDTAPAPLTPGSQDFRGSGFEHRVDVRNFFDLYQSKNFSTDFTLGFEFKNERFKFDDPVNATFYPDESLGQKASKQVYAPYFLQNFKFFDEALILSAGARFDHDSTFGSKWSPRFSLLYHLKKTNTTFRTSYGEGFHAPTILEFFTTVLQRNLGLPFLAARLQPELSKGVDFGIDQKFGKWVEADITFFYTKYDQLFDELQLIQNAHTLGIETSLKVKPLSSLELGANYTFLKAKNDDNGQALANRPSHHLNAYIEGKPLEALTLRLDANWVSSRVIPNTLSTDTGDFSFVFIDSNGKTSGRTLAGHATLDFAASYQIAKNKWHLKDWKVYTKLQNLLNTSYQDKFGFDAPRFHFIVGTKATF